MTQKIKERVKEGSQATFSFTFRNSVGALATPDTTRWSLVDKKRNVINNRRHVVETPANPLSITVYGNDLRVTDAVGSLATRLLLIEATDAGKPIVEEFEFKIEQAKSYPITTTTTTV